MAETSTKLGRVSLVPRGEYDPQAQYHRLDVMQYNGSSFLALRDLQGVTPSDGTDYMLIAQAGAPGADGADGEDGADGAPGSSIASVERTSGTGAAGTTDTYTITLTDGSTSTFDVYNGADGTGSGDMLKSIYDPQNKNKDVFADRVNVAGGATSDMPASLGAGPYTIEYTEDDPSEVSAGQVSYNGAQSGIQADTVQGALDELDGEVDQLGAEMELVSNENILRNWYFADPVNQKRQTEYTGPGYTIDGWLLRNVGASVIIVDGGIKVSPQWFVQDFEADRISPGKYTLSCLCFGGGISNMTVGIYTDTGIIDVPVTIKSTGPLAYGTFSVPELSIGHRMGLSLVSDLTGNTIFKAAKLELGSKQTLAHQDADGNWVLNDPPPDKALELAKCQRYIVTYEAVNGQSRYCIGIAFSDHHVLGTMTLPEQMRATPSIIASGDFALWGGGNPLPVKSITVVSYMNNVINLDIYTESVVTNSMAYQLIDAHSANSRLIFDAGL